MSKVSVNFLSKMLYKFKISYLQNIQIWHSIYSLHLFINGTMFSSSSETARQKWRITTQMWYVQFCTISFHFVPGCDFTHTTVALIS